MAEDQEIGDFNLKTEEVEIHPSKLKLGWKIYEIPPDMTTDEFYKKELSDEEYKKWSYESSHERSMETDRSDKYISHLGVKPTDIKSYSYTEVDVLSSLKGQPWNNLALNYVLSLNPSSIRVSSDLITCDCHHDRITVMLEEDGENYKKYYKGSSYKLSWCCRCP